MVKKPITYVILGVLLIASGLLLQKFAGAYYTSQAYFSQLVEKNLEEELKDLEYDMIPILDSVSAVELIKYEDFNLPTKYPYFIYGNQELKVWSDYHFAPEYELIAGEYSVKLIRHNNDVFIARKWFAESIAGQFEIVCLLPIYTEFAVQNKYLANFANEDLFSRQDVTILTTADEMVFAIELRNNPLFWIASEQNFSLAYSPYKNSLFFIYSLAILLLLTAIILWTRQKAKVQGKWVLLITAFMVWVVLKVTMSIFDFPSALLGIDLFDSRFFAVSWFERSFGDMLLNTIMIFILSMIAFKHYRIILTKALQSSMARMLYAVVLVFLLNLVFNYQYLQLRTIYFNSQISLDITQSLTFDSFRILAVLVFLLISLSTAMLFHVLFKRLEIQAASNREKALSLLVGSISFWLFTYLEWQLLLSCLFPKSIILCNKLVMQSLYIYSFG